MLCFSFPDLHREARVNVALRRTYRVVADGEPHERNGAEASIQLRHVDDFADKVPKLWRDQGGVMAPLHGAEALRVVFSGRYPFAIKIAAGRINALTLESWSNELHDNPQDYLVVPQTKSVDGFLVNDGLVRQFVAPLDDDTFMDRDAEMRGGMQIIAYPLRRELYERLEDTSGERDAPSSGEPESDQQLETQESPIIAASNPRGFITQAFEPDLFGIDAWNQEHSNRCFIHIASARSWFSITGENSPTGPFSPSDSFGRD